MKQLTITIQNDTTAKELISILGKIDGVYVEENKVVIKGTGEFSVAPNRKVCFANGNLITDSTGKHHFAKHQYDFFFRDEDNQSCQLLCVESHDVQERIVERLLDCGNEKIDNYLPHIWRTLTINEWRYLLEHHYFTRAKVGDIRGLLIYPNEYAKDKNMIITHRVGKYFRDNTITHYSIYEFERLESECGVLFLPEVEENFGVYMSATPIQEELTSFENDDFCYAIRFYCLLENDDESDYDYYLNYGEDWLDTEYMISKFSGKCAVRLVHDC